MDSQPYLVQRLLRGNVRYVARSHVPEGSGASVRPGCSVEASAGDEPSLVVITCGDLKLSPAEVFDLATSEVLVVQTAACSSASAARVGAEYAWLAHDVKLVVVLGHVACRVLEQAIAGPGVIFREVEKSRARLVRQAQKGVTTRELARNHTLRMARKLRSDLAHLPSLDIVPMLVDEHSGVVSLITDPHAWN